MFPENFGDKVKKNGRLQLWSSPSLISPTVCVDVKQAPRKKKEEALAKWLGALATVATEVGTRGSILLRLVFLFSSWGFESGGGGVGRGGGEVYD